MESHTFTVQFADLYDWLIPMRHQKDISAVQTAQSQSPGVQNRVSSLPLTSTTSHLRWRVPLAQSGVAPAAGSNSGKSPCHRAAGCSILRHAAASPVQPAGSDSVRSSCGPAKIGSQNRHSKIFAPKSKSHTVLSTERKAEGIFMKGTAPAFACDKA